MKKTTATILTVVIIAFFLILTYFGLKYSRGVPVVIEKPSTPVLDVAYLDTEINLEEGVSLDIWVNLKPTKVKLLHQVTVIPWPRIRVPDLTVKAFHNKKDIYFYLSWKDTTEDRVIDLDKFTDACAIMFPLEEKTERRSIMMGFMGKSNIWQWKASQDMEFWLKQAQGIESPEIQGYPEFAVVSMESPKSAVNDLLAIRVGTLTPKETQEIQGRGLYDKDREMWHVVFRRAAGAVTTGTITEPEELEKPVFSPGLKRWLAFAVWNGYNGDRGGRKSISNWVELAVR